jgi:hypothetical protein
MRRGRCRSPATRVLAVAGLPALARAGGWRRDPVRGAAATTKSRRCDGDGLGRASGGGGLPNVTFTCGRAARLDARVPGRRTSGGAVHPDAHAWLALGFYWCRSDLHMSSGLPVVAPALPHKPRSRPTTVKRSSTRPGQWPGRGSALRDPQLRLGSAPRLRAGDTRLQLTHTAAPRRAGDRETVVPAALEAHRMNVLITDAFCRCVVAGGTYELARIQTARRVVAAASRHARRSGKPPTTISAWWNSAPRRRCRYCGTISKRGSTRGCRFPDAVDPPRQSPSCSHMMTCLASIGCGPPAGVPAICTVRHWPVCYW